VQDERPTLKSQVEKIRNEIQEYGESIVGCEALRGLCLDEIAQSGQWEAIAKISIIEGWCFTFFPNGSVRFAKF
jgi:hypothetical protein